MAHMENIEKIIEKFDPDGEIRKETTRGYEILKEFLEKYPFHTDPKRIEDLTKEEVYEKGGEYFFHWIEYKLRDLGRIYTYATYYENASENLEIFKDLLKQAVNTKPTRNFKVSIDTITRQKIDT